jgi:hypothetical protein
MSDDHVSRSSQSWSRYMTRKGLTEHIGTFPVYFHLYIAKEDLDNGTDYIENNYMNAYDVRVIGVSIQKSDGLLTFTVTNSNPDNKPTAFQTNLANIFNYEYFTSTKKNKFRISRGAIGDANKPKLSIPYALRYDKDGNHIDGKTAPMSIRYNDKESKISLDTSKFIVQKLESIIETNRRSANEKPYTQVQISIPAEELSYDMINELEEYCLDYSIFSTHIKFLFNFNGTRISIPDDTIAASTWTNPITAWAYTDDEFFIFLENLVNQSLPISEALKSFRELKWLPKEWMPKRLSELSAKEKSSLLLAELKDHSSPMKELSTPFGGNRESDALRKDALLKRIAAVHMVDESYVQYKVVRARYVSRDKKVNFPYVFEVMAVPFDDINTNHHLFIGAVNNSVSIINRGRSLYDGEYHFEHKGRQINTWNMEGILSRWYGDSLKEAKKSWPCVIVANLLTPKVHWREQGKSTHVIEPFANTIVETIAKVMKQIPTFHGLQDLEPKAPKSNIRKKHAIDYLAEFLIERKKAVDADPDLIYRDRLTQSSVWYRIRPQMRIDFENGIFKPNKSWSQTRRYLTSIIDNLCKGDELYQGKKLFPGEDLIREDLGIFAIAKGMMIYRGEVFPVSIDNIKTLASKGIAVWVIEKEGIPDIIAPFAADYGIALVTSGGRFPKYVKRLIEEIKRIGSVVQIGVDYDADGTDIANSTYSPTIKIGLDMDIVPWLQDNGFPDITKETLQESYTPTKGIPIPNEYLSHHRLELDSVVAKANAEALFKYFLYKSQLPENAPNGFNMLRVVSIPDNDTFYPPTITEKIQKLDNYKDQLLKPLDDHLELLLNEPKAELEEELECVKELDTIENKNDFIKKDLEQFVANDKDIKSKVEAFANAIDELVPNNPATIHVETQDKIAKKQPGGSDSTSTAKASKAKTIKSKKEEPKREIKCYKIPESNGQAEEVPLDEQANLDIRQDVDSTYRIDEKRGGESHNVNNEPTLDSSNLKYIEEALSNKYPNMSGDEIRKIMNLSSASVKIYRLFRAQLKMASGGEPAAKRDLKKALNDATKSFNGVQHILSTVDIHMDSDGNINGKWIWGKIVDEN